MTASQLKLAKNNLAGHHQLKLVAKADRLKTGQVSKNCLQFGEYTCAAYNLKWRLSHS